MIGYGSGAAGGAGGGLEGAPILCKRCGAPTDPMPDLSLRCRHCGTPDRLPPDELGRALEIRGRLTLAAGRVAQLAGTESALASIFEKKGAFLTVMGPWPVLAVLVVAYAIVGTITTLSSLPASVPDSTRMELVIAAAYGPLFVLGITISFPLALLVGRFSYSRKVRPLLSARPPFQPGAPMRCRACGGDLHHATDAFVTCRFCRTPNVLAHDAARSMARRLDKEIAGYRQRASGLIGATSSASTHMTRTLFICFGLVYAGIIAFGMIASFAVKLAQ